MYRCARATRGWGMRLAVGLALLASNGNWICAANGADVLKVEEDWELVVGTPDSDLAGPQISCALAPTGSLAGVYSILTLNHQSHPSFVPGGMQLQVWDNETTLEARNFPNNNLLSTTGETVSWTQSMRLSEGTLDFEVLSGASTTWGNFGGQGYLRSSTTSSLANLNGYDPAVSAANSGVNFASNRVQSLVLKRVRRTLASGEVLEDNTARVVHQQNP